MTVPNKIWRLVRGVRVEYVRAAAHPVTVDMLDGMLSNLAIRYDERDTGEVQPLVSLNEIRAAIAKMKETP